MWLRTHERDHTRPTLNRDRIVAAAITQLDEEGTAHLTMRKLATRLEVAPMTLYGHVATKNDLLELAVDEVFAESIADHSPSGEWRVDVMEIADRTFDALLRHSWAPPLIGVRPLLGPGAAAHFSEIMQVLAEAGFDGEHLDSAIAGLYYYVLGAAVAESGWSQVDPRDVQRYSEEIEHAVTRADQPEVPMTAYLRRQAGGDARRRYREGLSCVLDGLRHPLSGA